MSAFVLIVVIAVAAFLRTFESNAQRLTYVNSFVNSSVNLMEYKFVWLWVGDTLCRIGYYFGVVVVNDVIMAAHEVYARFFAPANAVIEMETAVPEVEVLTAPVATAPPPRANAGVAPNTAPPPALTEQAAVEPRQQEAADDVPPERRPAYAAFRENLRLQDVAQEVAIEEARARCRLEGAAHQQR